MKADFEHVLIGMFRSGTRWSRAVMSTLTVSRIPFHHDYTSLAGEPDPRWAGKRIFLQVRDPRDAACSWFFYKRDLRQVTGYRRIGLQKFVTGDHGVPKFITWLNTWISARKRASEFDWVRFEDLVSDPVREFSRMGRFFMKREVQPEEVEKILEVFNFESLKKNKPLHYPRGKVGSYRDLLPRHAVKEVDRMVREGLEKYYGYD